MQIFLMQIAKRVKIIIEIWITFYMSPAFDKDTGDAFPTLAHNLSFMVPKCDFPFCC